MTIEEKINQFEKLASNYEFNLEMHRHNVMKLSVNDIERMKRDADENRQLAKWLRELKAYRETREILEVINKNTAESEDKKDIERQMWDDFHELTTKYYYYINAYEDMTKAGLPLCFTPRIDAKYIKCLADGIEQALGAIVTATKDLTERSGIDGEQRGQG